MSYYNQLHPWCIIQCLPHAQTRIIARFHRRNDAEAHLRILRQLTPTVPYDLIFDVHPTQSEKGDRLDTLPFQPSFPSSAIEMNSARFLSNSTDTHS